MSSDVARYIEKAYAELCNALEDRRITIEEVVEIAPIAIKIADRYKKLTGPKKKELVREITQKYLQEHTGLKEGEILIGMLVLDKAVELAIDLWKGRHGLFKTGGRCGCFARKRQPADKEPAE